MLDGGILIFTIVFGLIIGSFLSVCVYRIPLGRKKGLSSLDHDEDEDIAENDPTNASVEAPTQILKPQEATEVREHISIAYPPRSFCPNCRQQLSSLHNIPVFSWLLLGGKCAFCKDPIPFRYPLIEILSAFFCVASYSFFDPYTATVVYIFCATLIVLSFIDLDYYILPNVITYPGTALGLFLAACNQYTHIFKWPIVGDLWGSLWGFLAGAGFLFVISEGYFRLRGKVGLGMGDVKLLAMVGVLFGPECAFMTIFLGSFVGAILGSLLLLLQRNSLKRPLPFGPYLALGTLLYLFLGPDFPGAIIRQLITGRP